MIIKTTDLSSRMGVSTTHAAAMAASVLETSSFLGFCMSRAGVSGTRTAPSGDG